MTFSLTQIYTPIRKAILSALLLCSVGLLSAQQMPQDYWVDQGVSFPISTDTAYSYVLPPVADQANHIYWAKSSSWTNRTGLVSDGSQQTIWTYVSQIDLMDDSLNVTKQFGSFWYAQGMTCDSSNHLYVLDSDGRVYVYDSKQNLVTTFPTGCQNGPSIPVATVYYWGTDWNAQSITNASGYNSAQCGNVWSHSSAISINAKDELFICDFASASVKVYSTQGTLLRSWGGVGIGMNNFRTAPWKILVNPDQTVSVIDNTSPAKGTWQDGAYIIKNFDLQGNYLGQTPYNRGAMSMTIAPDGFRPSSGLFNTYKSIEGGYISFITLQGNSLPNGDVILVGYQNTQKYSPYSSTLSYFLKYLLRSYYGKDL
jgi:hypothetical protein